MIRTGVVGFGLAAKVFHAPFLEAVEGLELAAVVERSTRHAEAAYPRIVTYPTLEAMLQDASLELIVVATPNISHVPLATEALRAGRHVVVDKPAAITSPELAALSALASESGKLLIPFHNRRFDSDFQTILKLVREETLGRIVALDSAFERWRPMSNPGTQSRAWREQGGPGTGVLLDLGTHLVDQSLVLFGRPTSVSAEVLCEREGSKANDSFTIRLHYANRVVTLFANCLSSLPGPRFRIRGAKGNYEKWGVDPQEPRLRADAHAIQTGGPQWAAEAPEHWGTLAIDAGEGGSSVSIVTRPLKPVSCDYRQYYEAVRDAILGKSAPPVLATEALDVARILEWATESHAQGRQIVCHWD